jgi:hypothetical protein
VIDVGRKALLGYTGTDVSSEPCTTTKAMTVLQGPCRTAPGAQVRLNSRFPAGGPAAPERAVRFTPSSSV